MEDAIIDTHDIFDSLRGWWRRKTGATPTRGHVGRPTWQLLAEQSEVAAALPLPRIRREMAAATELAYALGEDARAYATRLENRMVELAETPALRELLGATREMILRIEASERLIRKCGDEIELLRRTIGRDEEPAAPAGQAQPRAAMLRA